MKTKEGYNNIYENIKTDEYFDDLIIDKEKNINDSLVLSINVIKVEKEGIYRYI